MKPIKFILPLLSLLLLTGCASPVVSAGPDTHYISYGPLPIWMSAAKAKAECYQQANAWCAARGLVMVPVSDDAQEPIAGRKPGSAELTFLSLKPGDPRIKSPNLDQPTTIQRIESR
jgi:hypothetical protein